jgi:hypothetical protein
MPWTARSGPRKHTRKANTTKKRRAWAEVADKVRTNLKYGRTVKQRESSAVRIANSVVNRLSGGTGSDNRRKSVAVRRKKRGPGRPAGFKHSAATKRKMSRSHKARHRSGVTKRRKYARRSEATLKRVKRTLRGLHAAKTRVKNHLARRRVKRPGRPRKSTIKRAFRRK